MSTNIRSTLSEIHLKLNEVVFSILNSFDSERWVDPKQVIYSTVQGWDTAYEAYLVYRRIDNVKFPFAALTRVETQETFKMFNKTLQVSEPYNGVDPKVNTAIIKPVRLGFNLAIYDKSLQDIETFADLIMVEGHATQRLLYDSIVLGQPSEISFVFEEPTHSMIPDKNAKRKENGFIYGLDIPIIVDGVLGLKSSANLITTAVSKVLPRVPDPLPDDIIQEVGVEIEIINDNS